MGQAIPRQQPAVIPRSQFNQLRALLAVALVAVACLIAAVVILATDGDEAAGTSAAKPAVSTNESSGSDAGTGEADRGPVSLREVLGRRAAPAD
jgi:hypothetical protein